MAYLHENGWVHHDLRTNNIFMKGNGDLKIGGLAESFFKDVHFSDKTFQVGIDAPEVALSGKHERPEDVYQLGLCALQAFFFHHPYRGLMRMQEVCRAQMMGELPRELELLQEKEPLAYDLIARCLGPRETRPTALEVLQHPYVSEVEGLPLPPPPVKPTPLLVPGACVRVCRALNSPFHSGIVVEEQRQQRHRQRGERAPAASGAGARLVSFFHVCFGCGVSARRHAVAVVLRCHPQVLHGPPVAGHVVHPRAI